MERGRRVGGCKGTGGRPAPCLPSWPDASRAWMLVVLDLKWWHPLVPAARAGAVSPSWQLSASMQGFIFPRPQGPPGACHRNVRLPASQG